MATGDDALLGGMTLVLGSASAKDIDEFLNRVMDYIANGSTYWKPSFTLPISRGGHGATTASGARTALGVPTTPAALGAAADGIGTGLSFYSPGFNRLSYAAPGVTGGTELARQADVDSRVAKSGDTMSGDLYLPASSAASSGWTIGYIDGSGRVCRGASSERFKDNILIIDDPRLLGDLFPDLHSFTMKGDTGHLIRFGDIAERLNESDALRPFVVYERVVECEQLPVYEQLPDFEQIPVYDEEEVLTGYVDGDTIVGYHDSDRVIGHIDGPVIGTRLARDAAGDPIPLSIDFIGLLRAQTAQLHARVLDLETQFAALKALVMGE